MKTPNGWSGGLNPGQMLVVARLKRVAESQPTAWEGESPDGHKVHIAYRFGEVSIEIRRPVSGKPGRVMWETVARFNPALIEAELAAQLAVDSSLDPYARRLLVERGMVREIRQSSEADMQAAIRGTRNDADILLNRGRLVIRDGQLVRWLEQRNRNLGFLAKRGVAGGAVQVAVELAREKRD